MVCWWVVFGVITAPFFLQVTVVAGPPVEVQVRVMDRLSYSTLVTCGEPNQGWQMMIVTINYICSVKRKYWSKGNVAIKIFKNSIVLKCLK